MIRQNYIVPVLGDEKYFGSWACGLSQTSLWPPVRRTTGSDGLEMEGMAFDKWCWIYNSDPNANTNRARYQVCDEVKGLNLKPSTLKHARLTPGAGGIWRDLIHPNTNTDPQISASSSTWPLECQRTAMWSPESIELTARPTDREMTFHNSEDNNNLPVDTKQQAFYGSISVLVVTRSLHNIESNWHFTFVITLTGIFHEEIRSRTSYHWLMLATSWTWMRSPQWLKKQDLYLLGQYLITPDIYYILTEFRTI